MSKYIGEKQKSRILSTFKPQKPFLIEISFFNERVTHEITSMARLLSSAMYSTARTLDQNTFWQSKMYHLLGKRKKIR